MRQLIKSRTPSTLGLNSSPSSLVRRKLTSSISSVTSHVATPAKMESRLFVCPSKLARTIPLSSPKELSLPQLPSPAFKYSGTSIKRQCGTLTS